MKEGQKNWDRIVPLDKPPANNAPEREKAIYWRINVMHLTQEKLARLLNVRRSTIWRFESGEQPITTMYRLACLGVMFWREWNPEGWPHFGDKKFEEATFKRFLHYDPEQED